MAEAMTNVLVVGVTGWLGNHVAHELLDRGKSTVRALVRAGAAAPEKVAKISELQAKGMTVSVGDLTDRKSLADACKGIDVVVSVVQGGTDVIIDGQRNLLAAAEAAGVRRMIPSDFSMDLTSIDFGDNANNDLRKRFDESFATSTVAPTSINCGGFLEMILSPYFSLVDWPKGVMSYWGDGNQPVDYTAVPDVARYTAAAAVDAETSGIPLRIAGNSLTLEEMRHAFESATGRRLVARSLGTVDELRQLIEEKKRTAKNPWEWISLQYTWCGVSGKGKMHNLDNARYPEIKPVSVEDFVRSNLSKLPSGH